MPLDHLLRQIKARADEALNTISADPDALYSHTGHPSIAPERLLKAQLLIALHSIGSEPALCERLDYNLLYRSFPDMTLGEPGLDQSNFSWLREHLVATDLAHRFFNAVLAQAKAEGLLGLEHFTVDGALIEALASLKSLKRRDDERLRPDGPDGSGMKDCRGERRSNATHVSSTHAEAKLMRKGNGQPAKLSFGAHVLMDNHEGLIARIEITDATEAEHQVAARLTAKARKRRWKVKSGGADKGYCVKASIVGCRKAGIAPHVARIEGRHMQELDARTTRHAGYRVSRRKRKHVEEIFGCLKTHGGLRKTRFVGPGRARVALHTMLTTIDYNLLRMATLTPIAVT